MQAMEALRHLEAVYADWERQVKDEARQAGERTGLIESIEMLCAAFEIELSDQRRQQLASWDIQQLKEAFATITATRHWLVA